MTTAFYTTVAYAEPQRCAERVWCGICNAFPADAVRGLCEWCLARIAASRSRIRRHRRALRRQLRLWLRLLWREKDAAVAWLMVPTLVGALLWLPVGGGR